MALCGKLTFKEWPYPFLSKLLPRWSYPNCSDAVEWGGGGGEARTKKFRICLGFPTKARSVLEQARQRNPKCPEMWLEAVRIETRGEKKEYAKSLMAKGQFFISNFSWISPQTSVDYFQSLVFPLINSD